MEEWDVKLIEKAGQARIKLLLYKRYKDDINVTIDKFGILEARAIISDQSMMIKLKALAYDLIMRMEWQVPWMRMASCRYWI